MSSPLPAEALAPPAGPRLRPARMPEALAAWLSAAPDAKAAVLVLRLSPLDRLAMLASEHAGRPILAEIGRRIEGLLKERDRYAFVSREEVWMILAGPRNPAVVRLAAHALLERIRRPIDLPAAEGGPVRLQPAVGGAWASAEWLAADPARNPARAFLAAGEHAALHKGDASGIAIRELRPGVGGAASVPDVDEAVKARLAENALEICFQPQVELAGGGCHSAEALVRWPSGTAFSVAPDTIVAACERNGLIAKLTKFTLDTTLRQMAQWKADGVAMTVSVNLSASMLADPSLPTLVSQALATWNTDAGRLTIELTESALVHDSAAAGDAMRRLRELGCRLSIDDFGTGYSPFSYLRQFPVDELKIDKSFVGDVTRDARDRRIVEALVDLGHSFGMQVVAEGIEDEATETSIRSLGCDLGQGWHYARALPADDFATWVRSRNRGAATVASAGA